MNTYSIVRVGNEYVVRAGEKSILKVSSRRRALRLISDAGRLLNLPPPSGEEPPAAVAPRAVNGALQAP
jgi:hypothetical protein